MLIAYDPDEFETIWKHHTCGLHKIDPSGVFPGCTCSNSYTQRRRSNDEIAKIKAARRREEEDHILARARIIENQRRREGK